MKKAIVLLALLSIVACGKKEEEKKTKDVVIENSVEMNKEEVKPEEKPEVKTEEVTMEEVKEDVIAEDMNKEEVAVEEPVVQVEAVKPYDYYIGRSRLTSGVENKEPLEEQKVYQKNDRAYFFTEFKDVGAEEKVIHHKWYFIGKDEVPELMADVKLKVKGSRWRTWSSKELYIPGEWIVEVEDHLGNIIASEKMTVN